MTNKNRDLNTKIEYMLARLKENFKFGALIE